MPPWRTQKAAWNQGRASTGSDACLTPFIRALGWLPLAATKSVMMGPVSTGRYVSKWKWGGFDLLVQLRTWWSG